MKFVNIKSVTLYFAFILVLYIMSTILAYSAPGDMLQGNYSKIMYVHVPSAWIASFIYIAMGLSNFAFLIKKYSNGAFLAYALAPIGASFTLICLITGSIWGKPVWNTWWVWDARLTSMLILMFLYIGYILVWSHKKIHMKTAAVLNCFGLINIPIIKFSVYLWSTLHQKSSFFRSEGISIDSTILFPLLLFLTSSVLLTLLLSYLRYRYLATIFRE